MSKLDCLLIHTPKFDNYYPPFGHYTWLNYMPIGLLGLADHLHKSGVKCRILHQGVEWLGRRIGGSPSAGFDRLSRCCW